MQAIEQAYDLVKRAGAMLRDAECPKAFRAVRRAEKSVEGAKRHAERRPVVTSVVTATR